MQDRTARKIDALIAEVMREESVPGVAVAVTEGGELTYARARGDEPGQNEDRGPDRRDS